MKFGLRAGFTALCALVIGAGLASCQNPPAKPGPQAPPAVSPQPARTAPVEPLGPGRIFQIAPGESEVRILVFRAGTLAKLGHNHVITSHELSGTVTVPDDPAQTRFEITMPVATLTIDDPDERARAGADFATQVNDNAREGTRRNLMKPQVLDGDHFAAVKVRSKSIAPSGADYDVTFEVDLRGATHEITAPTHEEISGDRLIARGEMTVKLTDLGLTPFTAAMGALAIKDEIRIQFDIEAMFSAR